MLGIILGILLFMFLVLIHELGHFIAAKKTGVQVLEFGMGIPPKIATLWTDKSGTAYTLNAIPLGGFVRLKGEDPSDPSTFRAKDSFIMASFWSKTVILLAGVTVNFVFAWFVLTMLFRRGTSPLMVIPDNAMTEKIASYLTPTMSFLVDEGYVSEDEVGDVIVQQVLDDSIASRIGILSGDIVSQINDTKITNLNFQQVLQTMIGQDIVIQVERGGEVISFDTQCGEDNCILGVGIARLESLQDLRFQFGLIQSARLSLNELGLQARLTLNKLGTLGASLFSGSKDKIDQEMQGLTGPVGAVKFVDTFVDRGMWTQLLMFGALISFALAIFNLLPIPALDGGRWLGVIIQRLFFAQKIEKYFMIESYINFVFFVLLMGLGIYIILKDLVGAWGLKIPFIG